MGGGVAGVATPLLIFKKKGHPRDRCDRFSCYLIKQCVCVFVEWCCCLNKAQLSHDCLAEAAPKS